MSRAVLFALFLGSITIAGCDSNADKGTVEPPPDPVTYTFATSFTHERQDIPLGYEYFLEGEITLQEDGSELTGTGTCTYRSAVIANGTRRDEVAGVEMLVASGRIDDNYVTMSFEGCQMQISRNNVDRPFTGLRSSRRIELKRESSLFSEMGRNVHSSYSGNDPWLLPLIISP